MKVGFGKDTRNLKKLRSGESSVVNETDEKCFLCLCQAGPRLIEGSLECPSPVSTDIPEDHSVYPFSTPGPLLLGLTFSSGPREWEEGEVGDDGVRSGSREGIPDLYSRS